MTNDQERLAEPVRDRGSSQSERRQRLSPSPRSSRPSQPSAAKRAPSSGEPTQQPSPRQASTPSRTATAAISSPTAGSSHQAPSSALPSEADEKRAGEVGAEHVLASLALGRRRADLVGEPFLGDAEHRHEDDRADREGDAEDADVGVLAVDQRPAPTRPPT